MWKLWPTKAQYLSWSMPSKLTFISAYVGILTLVVSGLSSLFSYLLYSAEKQEVISYLVQSNYNPFGSEVYLEENGISKLVYSDKENILTAVKIEDFDLDGNKDLLLSAFTGGNCCPNYYSILLAKGDGYVKVLGNDEFWSWNEPEVDFVNNKWLFRITQHSMGVGNTSGDQSRITFEIDEGKLKVVEKLNKEERPKVAALAELYSSYYTDNPSNISDEISIKFDLNENGIEDEIICTYWERWGSLLCNIEIDHLPVKMNLGCNRVGITTQIHNGYHALVCGVDDILVFNKITNSYEVINKN